MDSTVLLAGLAALVMVLVVALVWAVRRLAHTPGRNAEQLSTAASPDSSARDRALQRREELLAEREERLDRYLGEIRNREARLDQIAEDLDRRDASIEETERTFGEALERAAGMSAAEARETLLAQVEREVRQRAAQLARDIEADARDNAEAKARRIIATSIQRLAGEQSSESVVASVHLPSEEMKGRIIGRDGRNIRAFEQLTGVNLIIDDTPESVLLSCFDPVRREVARRTLTELISDGRINPARIEDFYDRSQEQVRQSCLAAAEDALMEMGISDLDPGLVPYLGALTLRTSYGQNVLGHLRECGRIAGLLAAELGLEPDSCRRAAFLHDIGKALTDQPEGSHALAGAELARRHGEHPDIVHAIKAHHNEVLPDTVEALLTQAADAISGGRPGARRESLELYVKRLQRLEEIAGGHEGVDRVFAMQAGREIRVMVLPSLVDDAQAQVIAADIARQVQDELTYPGSIKVTVVRESRATAMAR